MVPCRADWLVPQIAIRSDVHLLRSSVEQVQKQEITQASQVMARLSILDELKETLRATNHPVLKVNFEEQDSSLTVRREDVNLLVGALKLGDATASRQIAVNCEPVNEDIMQYGGKGAHHVAIYSRLSANILVHQFYGIAKKFDRRWAVMQDLRDVQTLSAAITSKSLPEAVIGRLNIAYDIAKTIAYLHSVDIVVKRLSDQNIRLVQKENVYTPYLTHLERARLVRGPCRKILKANSMSDFRANNWRCIRCALRGARTGIDASTTEKHSYRCL